MNKKALSKQERDQLYATLKARFEKNIGRHKGIDWKTVEERLDAQSKKLWSLDWMEESGGEPDVIGMDKKTGEIVFCDCSAETPKDRRSLCYDQEALNSRKENKPKNSAMALAEEMGVDILGEEEYHALQKLGPYDTKTSSWLKTPSEIRKLGGAIFGDFRFGRVFIYHNGAESYYAARGFRAILKV